MFDRREKSNLSKPTGIATDSDNVYISESEKGRVSVFNKDGQFVKSFGKTGNGPKEFCFPDGQVVAKVHGRRDLYVCDHGNNRVQVF